MWTVIVIVVVVIIFFVARSMYRHDGYYEVLDEKGRVIHSGTYKECVNCLASYKEMGWGNGYRIKRMKF